jgi:hypothetical protein
MLINNRMKQKIIVGLSLIILLFAVYMIARDLFRKPPKAVLAEDFTVLKQIDSSQLGFTRLQIIETGLQNLSGLTVNEDNSIFVCGGNQITQIDPNGKRSLVFNTDSVAKCIAINGKDIYVGTGSGIVHYNLDTRKQDFWKSYYNNSYITSIAINQNNVYVADANRRLVLKYDMEGNYIQDIGKKDSVTGAPGLIIPSLYFDIAFGSFNDLWIVNPGRLHFENYSTTGLFQSAWGNASFEDNGFSGCCNPAHFTILPDGSFVTYEKGIDKIKLFNPAGGFVCIVAGTGSFKGNADSQIGSINLVKDIAAGPDGNIYILDAFNQISVFKKKDS